jgi:hypothetical protein
VVIGIIGGMPECIPAGTAPPAGNAAAEVAAGAAPVQAVGTDSAPAEVA